MTSTESATRDRSTATADMKLEVVVIPVADADRSKAFYKKLGWRLDADFAFGNSRHPARAPRFSSGQRSRPPRLARASVCT